MVPGARIGAEIAEPIVAVASPDWRTTTRDIAFLAAAVVLSIISYIGGLGFYSDDWAFIGLYATAPDQTILGLYRASTSPL
ncbi:MAG: hypothetical protein EHM55_24920, partial [Acidobacteria bacterium]